MDQQILCFNHCGLKIFCFNLPEICPVCKTSISTATLREIPFRIPYPFVTADQHPCAVVMKPTKGTFLDDYQNSEDLHIGLTDSRGTVHEYDSDGLQNHKTKKWGQSLLIYKASEAWIDYWDPALDVIHSEKRWLPENYEEIYHNCYHFTLEFLKRLKCEELEEYVNDKEKFCAKFVVPKSSAAANYITLYRRIKRDGNSVENN